MKKYTLILLLMLGSWSFLAAQGLDHNTPVSKSGKMTCNVIFPLSVSPVWDESFLNWPTVPAGSKYILGTNGDEDSDKRCIFTFTGEANRQIEISFVMETMKDNVEISFTMKGTQTPPLGTPLNGIPILSFNNSKEIVNLSAGGKYYLHIIYNWVWAHEGAEPGLKSFVQSIHARYNDL